MDGKQYLNNIRAEEMSKEELQKEIKKLYEDNWAISKQCDTLEQMLSRKEVDYDKELIREKVIRKYANSNNYGWNIYSDRQDLEVEGLNFSEANYLPVGTERIAGEINADRELLPIHQKIKAYIGCWLDDCIEYLRGIWGITN